jgi:hypothetical protein
MSELQIPIFSTSEGQVNLIKALKSFHEAVGKVAKSSKNPFFKSDYADLPTILDAVKQPLIDNGLVLSHLPMGDNNLMTRLLHISGEFQQSIMYMKSVKDTPQDRGSVITYMTRYATGAHLGLSIDKDDDGNKGTGNGKAPKTFEKKAVKLKVLTEAISTVMTEFITKGDVDVVVSKLPTYADSPSKVKLQALVDAELKKVKK